MFYLHHLLLGILEALCDEVERLLLRNGVLGHPRLLGLEREQLGFSCTRHQHCATSSAWLGLILTFQKDGLFRENPSQEYL
jgi:hypothetical protein